MSSDAPFRPLGVYPARNSLISVGLLLFGLVVVLPLALMFALTFIGKSGFTLSAYSHELVSGRQWALLGHTLRIGLGTTFFALLLGVPLAFLTARTDLPGRRFFGTIYALPLFIPPYVVALCWRYYVGDLLGVNKVLVHWLNLSQPFWKTYGYSLACYFLGLSLFPLVTLLTRAALLTGDPSLEEAALFSRGGRATARGITMRLALPGIVAGATFVFLFALSNYGVPNLLMINSYAIEVYGQLKDFSNPNAATAASVPLIALSLIPLIVMWVLERNRRFSIARTDKPPYRFALGKWKIPAFLLVLFILIIAVAVPVVSMFIVAGGIHTYRAALKETGGNLLNSVEFATAAATGTALLAFVLAYGASRLKKKVLSTGLDVLSIMPFAIPAGVLGIALIRLWNHRGIANLVYSSAAILILGYSARFVPFAYRACAAGLKAAPATYEDAAELSGVRFGRRFTAITSRLSFRGLLAGWIVVFVLSLGDLGLSILVAPAGNQTSSIRIFEMIHFGYNSYVAAQCVFLIGIAVLPMVLFLILTGRKPDLK